MFRRGLFILVVLSSATIRTFGQATTEVSSLWNNGIDKSAWEIGLERNDRNKLLDLWESIGKDLEKPDHRLAGTYVKLDYNSGYFLRWSVTKGFIVVPYFDENLITDFGYGSVRVVSESDVVFRSERELKGGRGLPRMPQRWTAILGYFVPTESLSDFGRFRAGVGVYNEFNGRCCEFQPEFLAKRFDREPDSLAMAIPVSYAHFIKAPITAQITSVGKRKTVKDWGYNGVLYTDWMEKAVLIPVRIDVGWTRGVKRNMLFRVIGQPEFVQYVQIVRVSQQSSFGFVVRNLSFSAKETFRDEVTNEDKPIPPIRVGLKVTTSRVSD